jgi:hypothetical protein
MASSKPGLELLVFIIPTEQRAVPVPSQLATLSLPLTHPRTLSSCFYPLLLATTCCFF